MIAMVSSLVISLFSFVYSLMTNPMQGATKTAEQSQTLKKKTLFVTLHFIYLKLKFFPMKEVIHYKVFIAAYIIFLISTVSFDHQRTPKRTNDMARSNKIYLRHRNISVLRLRRWLSRGACV